MSTEYLRSDENPEGLGKRLAARLPLSLRRHLLFLRDTGRWGNFRNPKSFGEKMQWRIINDRRQRLSIASDRMATRNIAEEISAQREPKLYLPELIAFGASPNEVMDLLRHAADSGQLPVRWVLKPNNSSGKVLVTHGTPDWSVIAEALSAWSAYNRLLSLHWLPGYAGAQTGFIAEAWIGPHNESPLQWYVTLIDGTVVNYAVEQRIGTIRRREIRDAAWREVPSWFHSSSTPIGMLVEPAYKKAIDDLATRIARGWDFLRVDLYYADGKIWLGELTPYSSEGLIRTTPGGRLYDDECGARWVLPTLESVREGNP